MIIIMEGHSILPFPQSETGEGEVMIHAYYKSRWMGESFFFSCATRLKTFSPHIYI